MRTWERRELESEASSYKYSRSWEGWVRGGDVLILIDLSVISFVLLLCRHTNQIQIGMPPWFLRHRINLHSIFYSKKILVNIPCSTALPVLCIHLMWSIYSTVIIQHVFVKSEPVCVLKTEDIMANKVETLPLTHSLVYRTLHIQVK